MEKFAAIGSDGLRTVVWGVGDSEGDALSDASLWLGDDFASTDLVIRAITSAQFEAVLAGNISWECLQKEIF